MTDAAIVVEGLTKHFGAVKALDGIDFDVPGGTVFGLLGPNGAGKTTAVRVLATVLHPDGGSARVLGRDVVREADAVRRRIGLAGQFAAIDPNLTGRENLQMVGVLGQLEKPQILPRADELLERFELTDAATRPARTYSGGMRRRLDIAAALMRRPAVLFLDEPTTGLDLHSRNELWEMIRELVRDGTTVLLTTQYLEEADRLASRIAVIDGGRVIASDTPTALKEELGGTVVELSFADAGLAVRAAELLRDRVGGHPETEERMVRIAYRDGARILMDVLRTLDADDLEPDALSVRAPSLDDVFLVLTGHPAEAPHIDDAPAPAGARPARGAR